MKMTILHSCCCWNSVRKGSIACGIYTAREYRMAGTYPLMNPEHGDLCWSVGSFPKVPDYPENYTDLDLIDGTASKLSADSRYLYRLSLDLDMFLDIYYTLTAAQASFLLHEEINFLRNASNQSLIDHDITSETSAVFSALIFAFSSCGIVTTLLLFFGIYKDIKYLLIPWIFNMAFFTFIDVCYIVYGLVVHALQWNPSVAIFVTMDFFLNTLNLYTLLCVISQYQEYKAGRGRAIDDQIMRVPNIQYSTTQPTATSYLSSHNRKPVTYIDRATPTHSPTGFGPNSLEVPPVLANRGPRKSVKFGDSSEMTMVPPPPWVENKSSPVKGADTAPLIDSSGGGDRGGTVNV